jgi:hypothetical protein
VAALGFAFGLLPRARPGQPLQAARLGRRRMVMDRGRLREAP